MDKDYLRVGKLVNTQGIKGEVRVISVSDFTEERYQPGKQLILKHPDFPKPFPLTVRAHRKHKQFDILRFEGHDSINDVEPYKGGVLYVPKSELEELPEGEYYFHEIIGCDVYDEDGNRIGKVKEILQPGANDVWVAEREEDGKELLLPVIDECVKAVDVKNKKITVHIMEGLP